MPTKAIDDAQLYINTDGTYVPFDGINTAKESDVDSVSQTMYTDTEWDGLAGWTLSIRMAMGTHRRGFCDWIFMRDTKARNRFLRGLKRQREKERRQRLKNANRLD